MIDEGSFCTLPFVHISNRPDGAYAACCMIFESIYGQDGSPLFIQDGVTFEEAFRSPYMDSLRKSHLEGKKDPRCNICWSLEEQGIISKRMHDGLRYLEKTVKRLEEPKLPFAPLSWDIKLGSLCNLKCRMCSPFSSSSIMSEHINEKWIDYPETQRKFLKDTKNFFEYPHFREELLKLLPSAEEIYFLGGEPSLVPEHLEILDEAIRLGLADQIRVRWSTNLTRFDQRFIERANKFKNITLDCSIDGYGEICEYIRYPISWQLIEQRLDEIRAALPQAEVKVVCSVQIYNAFSLEPMIEWAERQGYFIFFNYVNDPDFYSAQHLPVEIKRQLGARYSEVRCNTFHRDKLDEFSRWLDGPGKPEAIHEFLQTTKRLDRVRKQDFWTLAPVGLQQALLEFTADEVPIDEMSFCTLPFVHLSSRTDGSFAPCCLIRDKIPGPDGKPLYIQKGATFEEAFRSPYMQSLRQSHLEGKKDTRCNVCWSMEERGIRSKRKFDGLQYFKKTKKRLAQKELPFAPLSWDVKLGSLCNLKCRMCSPYSSSEVMSEQLAESWIEYPEAKKDYIRSTKNFFENPEFKRELLKLLPFAEEIYFSGGEPSLLTDHLECLDEAIRLGLTDQIRVRWSTNLTRFDHRFTDRASKFKNIVLDCGVDGYGKVCEYIRYPVSWLQIEERLAEIRTALPLAEVKVICAVQVYNAFSLDRLIEWGEQGGHQIVFNYVNQPSCYSTQSLPPESKQRLARQYSGLQHEKLEEFLLWTQGPGDPEAMREFLLRTERLDRVRKQDFWTLAPEGLQNELMSFVGHQTERHPS